jgi:hypothetical protein
MGVQRKRRRREERLEEEEEAQGREPAEENVLEKERPKEKEGTVADRVLDLQKTAGNRATTAALARWGLPTLPLAAAPQWPKEPQVIIDGKAVPLQSWGTSHSSPNSGSTGRESVQLNDANIQTALGEHSSDLVRKAGSGERIKTLVIVLPGKDGKGVTFTFYDVYITGYSLSDRNESWSISFGKKEFSQSPPQAQPRP